ncbi:PLP-dependent transferase [Pleomassaria siparia CBS 279.74]|uniref:PLP-dependent transferase n=1 Tax=Pleomassaria siparia CBS 279.74 TaxID=1314801 RepID=A0A6G1JRG1_9PLEO|nr:PLP-dependent transferase [Pleomassaria siparia CBS 279.74]
MAKVPGGLWQNLIAVQVYGANTGVGKTVVSTLLGHHFARRKGNTRWLVRYIKPVSTGPSDEADEKYVRRYTNQPVATLFKYDQPVSPHLAVRGVKFIPTDAVIVQKLHAKLKADARACAMSKGEMGISLVETAGGVLSPGPSGTPQADIFRPMRMPVILVGDHRLGGIASTISASESLLIRGYDLDAVVCFDDGGKHENSKYLKSHFQSNGIPCFELPWIPDLQNLSMDAEIGKMMTYYDETSSDRSTYKLAGRLIDSHVARLRNLNSMSSRTKNVIWHPFTQHKSVEKPDDILTFDSAYGDYFQVKHTARSKQGVVMKNEESLLFPAFDASASWWTQGLGHGNPELSLAAAYAAGRYGHVMFGGATHEPALTLAERLLKAMKNPRLAKAFYTDDGSTAVEVGIKMALRASCKRYAWNGSAEDVGIIGLKGSYHGDTIGAMDASEPCVYNKNVDWYRGRGYWFDFPTIKMSKGRWFVEPPPGMGEDFGPTEYFEDLDRVFNLEERGHSPRYEAYIESVLDSLVTEKGRKFGALVMEPVILGAGGMIFVDPLFQQSLVRVVRRYKFVANSSTPEDADSWTGLPVVFDEVFTGLYRLGRFSAASFLQVHPDISVHAKLLTGGLLPLSVTLASESIFQAFWGDEKSDALLHGHSYTAHPIGCHVANTSLTQMQIISRGDLWKGYQKAWREPATTDAEELHFTMRGEEKGIWSMWSKKTTTKLSEHPLVDHVVAIGSVLKVSLRDKSGSGYSSTAAAGLRDALLNDVTEHATRVHCRVLGNVLYLMASMNSKDLNLVEITLLQQLSKL